MADPDLTRRLRNQADGLERDGITRIDPELWRAAADRIDQLEQQLADLHTAIGDPELLRHWSNWHAAECVDMHGLVAGHDGCCVEASRAHHLRRIAAAVEHTQEHRTESD